MITIQEIPVERIDEFWEIHLKYLVEDKIISTGEEIEYFSGNEYRDIIKSYMLRKNNKLHMLYFVREGIKIDAAQYCTYQTEDGKCFILDFWVFPEFRRNGTGHRCYDAMRRYTQQDGAKYYEINSQNEASIRFWKLLGFVENGRDEWGMPLFIKR